LRKKSLPRWLLIVLFVAPLVWSEYMFYVVNRWLNMMLFPIAWVGFWISLYKRRQREDKW